MLHKIVEDGFFDSHNVAIARCIYIPNTAAITCATGSNSAYTSDDTRWQRRVGDGGAIPLLLASDPTTDREQIAQRTSGCSIDGAQ
jgi:hypothetical protein